MYQEEGRVAWKPDWKSCLPGNQAQPGESGSQTGVPKGPAIPSSHIILWISWPLPRPLLLPRSYAGQALLTCIIFCCVAVAPKCRDLTQQNLFFLNVCGRNPGVPGQALTPVVTWGWGWWAIQRLCWLGNSLTSLLSVLTMWAVS